MYFEGLFSKHNKHIPNILHKFKIEILFWVTGKSSSLIFELAQVANQHFYSKSTQKAFLIASGFDIFDHGG